MYLDKNFSSDSMERPPEVKRHSSKWSLNLGKIKIIWYQIRAIDKDLSGSIFGKNCKILFYVGKFSNLKSYMYFGFLSQNNAVLIFDVNFGFLVFDRRNHRMASSC